MCASQDGNKLRILVADDEKIIADTLKLILTQANYEVTVVYDGLSAVEVAERLSPDLFLSDVFMPRLSGIDAAIQICSSLPHCKVLLFSGQSNLRELRREIESRCRRFEVCSKPIHPTELLAHLSELQSRQQ